MKHLQSSAVGLLLIIVSAGSFHTLNGLSLAGDRGESVSNGVVNECWRSALFSPPLESVFACSAPPGVEANCVKDAIKMEIAVV
jgi:hypothetical protein